jgi:hypothetical protein
MQENPETIKKYSGKGGIDFQGLSSVTSTISGFLLVISLLASSGALAGPMLNMIKVFKLVYSLRLINVYFGNILEAFLVALSEGFGSKAKPSNSSLTFFTSTRGKTDGLRDRCSHKRVHALLISLDFIHKAFWNNIRSLQVQDQESQGVVLRTPHLGGCAGDVQDLHFLFECL